MREPQPQKRVFIYLPILLAIALAIGIFIGGRLNFSANSSQPVLSFNTGQQSKIDKVINYIVADYVDTVNRKKLVDKTLTQMMQNLDPHSAYIPASEYAALNDPLAGDFDGIGVEFNVIQDTVRVVFVIHGGPSEKAGLKAGDKIVQVNGKTIAGVHISNDSIMAKLKGRKGTVVKVGIMRRGQAGIQQVSITRGEIPIYSIDADYMVNKKVGYIKLSRFAATSYKEFKKALDTLQEQGMKKLILDLRGNPGGYLSTVVKIANEFLPAGKMIVYTKGRARPKKEFKASSKGSFETQPLIILIDGGSASASEILSGAIQDNDRGLIVGRRSFGKGLVQEQSDFHDHSAIRLTVARYYTPTGRCIQKPYNHGIKAYYEEEYARYSNGQLEHRDSIHFPDSLKFKTPKGKIVYGGGGIMPDVFVPLDTSNQTHYLAELNYKRIISQFAYEYADSRRKKLKKEGLKDFLKNFKINDKLLNQLITYGQKKGVKKDHNEMDDSKTIIKTELKALIARNIWNNRGYYPVMHSIDNTFKKAVELMAKKNSPAS